MRPQPAIFNPAPADGHSRSTDELIFYAKYVDCAIPAGICSYIFNSV